MCLNELYGLGYRNGDEYERRIAAVTLEDVQRVAREYLDPLRRAEVFVGPAVDRRRAAAE
jgi:predicted Zn-dependent peptidase